MVLLSLRVECGDDNSLGIYNKVHYSLRFRYIAFDNLVMLMILRCLRSDVICLMFD